MFRILRGRGCGYSTSITKFAVQLNDTHPGNRRAELMRLLMDEALDVTGTPPGQSPPPASAYTNRTLLFYPRRWKPGSGSVRATAAANLQINLRNNSRFLAMVRIRYPGQPGCWRGLFAVSEAGQRKVRMANLAVVGSHQRQRVGRRRTANWCAASCSPSSARGSGRALHSTSPMASRPGAGTPWPTPLSPACSMRRSAPNLARDLGELQRLEMRFADDGSFPWALAFRARTGQTAPGEHQSIKDLGVGGSSFPVGCAR